MVSFVSTRLKRKNPEPDTHQLDPTALALIRDVNEQHRLRTMHMIYHISMIRMKRAPFLS